jgi:CO/xanthine dehydrogenase FAD-binding subunit
MPSEKGIWLHPGDFKELWALIKRYGPQGLLVAGGTDIYPAMRQGEFTGQKAYIDIAGIKALRGIELAGNTLRIGAVVTHGIVARESQVRQYAPLLSAASAVVGSPQVRNRGTIGGNIITLAACADTVPALAAHDASLVFYREGEKRTVELTAYLEDPALRYVPGEEFLQEVIIPLREAKGWVYHFEKIARRQAAAKSRISLACGVQLKDGVIADARLAVGAVTPAPKRYREAEALLIGEKPASPLFREAAASIAGGIVAVSGMRSSFVYKLPALKDLAVRILEDITGVNHG